MTKLFCLACCPGEGFCEIFSSTLFRLVERPMLPPIFPLVPMVLTSSVTGGERLLAQSAIVLEQIIGQFLYQQAADGGN